MLVEDEVESCTCSSSFGQCASDRPAVKDTLTLFIFFTKYFDYEFCKLMNKNKKKKNKSWKVEGPET